MPLFETKIHVTPLFARSLENLLYFNNFSRPGALSIVIVHLNEGSSFEGSIDTSDLLKPDSDGLLLEMSTGETRRYHFGTEPNQVEYVTCSGQPNCNVQSFHVDKQSIEVYCPTFSQP